MPLNVIEFFINLWHDFHISRKEKKPIKSLGIHRYMHPVREFHGLKMYNGPKKIKNLW